MKSGSIRFAKAKHVFRERTLLFYLESIAGDPLIYTMDHPKMILSSYREAFISALRVNYYDEVKPK